MEELDWSSTEQDMAEGKALDFDEVTAFLGDYGSFQIALMFLLSLTVIPVGYMSVVVVFVSDIPEFRCKENVSAVPERTWSSPRPGENLSSSAHCGAACPTWTFSNETYSSTIVSEWSLVCGDAWKVPFSTSLYFVGVLFGCFICGSLSDRFGRKPVFFSTLAMQSVSALIQAASVNWAMFCVLNFLRGFGQTACYMASTVLGTEMLSPKSRLTFCFLSQNVGFSVGYAVLALFGYFLRDWRMLLVACAIPGFLLMPLWWVIPESPRWLLQKKRINEAEAVICKAARMNHVPVPELIFRPDECLSQKEFDNEESRSYTCLDLLRTSNIRIITIIGCLVWFSSVTVFFGLSLNMSSLSGSKHLNLFFSALTDTGVYIVMWFVVNKVSRPALLSSSLFFCGILLLVLQLVPDDLAVVFRVLALKGRIGATAAFSFVIVFFIELMPTVVRNTAVGIFSTSGRIGTMLCPYIVYLGAYSKMIPYIVFGTISVVAAVFSVFLPDTRNVKLPDLISQVQPVKRPCCPKESVSAQL